jgi:hypothetical protein
MNWYITKIIFDIKVGEGGPATEFDEQMRFISARNENEAFLKARLIGVREEDSFVNSNFKNVKWEFIDVADLKQVGDLTDGMEIYSRIHETEAAESYIRFVQKRAAEIEKQAHQHIAAL